MSPRLNSLSIVDNNLLSKLTIILFAKGRKPFIIRQINLWANFPVNLVIIDNSDVPFSSEELSLMPTNVKYFHENTYFESFLRASSVLSTEYALIANDDDVYLPSGIVACITYLERNKNVISCIGQALSFYFMFNHILFDFVYSSLRDYSNLSDNVLERIKRKTNPYSTACFYAVHRSINLSVNLRTTIQSNQDLNSYCPPELEELAFEITTSIQGKSASVKNLMWLRSFRENQPLWKPPEKGFLHWLNSNQNSDFMNNWLRYYSTKLSELTSMNSITISNLLLEGLKSYSQNLSLTRKVTRESKKNRILLLKLKTNIMRIISLNSNIEKLTRSIMYYLRYTRTLKNISNFPHNTFSEKYLTDKLQSNNIYVDMSDFQTTGKFLLDSKSKILN
jgi:glycosyltransferase domain-containing protein